MKKIILIGASGTVGKAAYEALKNNRLVTASLSGHGCDYAVDISKADSLRDMFERVGSVDAVVNASGHCEYASFVEMMEGQWNSTVNSKLWGQINLVRIGLDYINEGGSFTLISGILNIKPIPTGIADATVSGAIDTFVKTVAYELPRGVRINAISPTVLEDSWEDNKDIMSGFNPVSNALVGKAYERAVNGFLTGHVLHVDSLY